MYHVIYFFFIRIKSHILQAWNQSVNEGSIYRGDYNILYIYRVRVFSLIKKLGYGIDKVFQDIGNH